MKMRRRRRGEGDKQMKMSNEDGDINFIMKTDSYRRGVEDGQMIRERRRQGERRGRC